MPVGRTEAIVSETVEAVERPDYNVRAAEILGVVKLFRHRSPVKVHELVSSGLPSRALLKAIENVDIPPSLLRHVFGVSERTFMRRQKRPSIPLRAEQSSRVWQFAEVLAKAKDVLGGSDRAVEWMLAPAMALEKHRPIDLLTSSVGAQLVDDVLERMRYGVYQ